MSVRSSGQIEDEEVYLAGHPAPTGHYRQIESRREIYLDEAGMLPASLDGRVACYERIKSIGSESQQHVLSAIARS